MGRQTVIVLDIDGVIAQECAPPVTSPEDAHRYAGCKLVQGARDGVQQLWGHSKILLWTSRKEEDRSVTVDWLHRHKIPYDWLLFDKPPGSLYVDDKAMHFSGWKPAQIQFMKVRAESQHG